jgi:hypothetical protein
MNDPLLRLISSGLRLWIASRCDQVGELDLTLRGSSLALLQGRLEGADLKARQVRFDGLPLQFAELSSGPIQLDLSLLKPGRMLALRDPFQVKGTVTLPGAELNVSLGSERWRDLADWMAEQLLGVTPLGALCIDNTVLELRAQVSAQTDSIHRRFSLQADAGTVRFCPLDDDAPSTPLPMDPSIRITDVRLAAGQVTLTGVADVSP